MGPRLPLGCTTPVAMIVAALWVAACAAPGAVDYRVEGDGIFAPLRGLTGDAERGRTRVMARDPANCVLCHEVPGTAVAGNLAPPLEGVGRRLDTARLRLRVVDEQRLVPDTIMPSYYRLEGLNDVAPEYRGRTILDAQAVEDIVAYLATLR